MTREPVRVDEREDERRPPDDDCPACREQYAREKELAAAYDDGCWRGSRDAELDFGRPL